MATSSNGVTNFIHTINNFNISIFFHILNSVKLNKIIQPVSIQVKTEACSETTFWSIKNNLTNLLNSIMI